MTGRKVGRDLSTPENRAFWEPVARSAEIAQWPAWKRAGINVSDRRHAIPEADGWWVVRRDDEPDDEWTCGSFLVDGTAYGYPAGVVLTLRKPLDARRVRFLTPIVYP